MVQIIRKWRCQTCKANGRDVIHHYKPEKCQRCGSIDIKRIPLPKKVIE